MTTEQLAHLNGGSETETEIDTEAAEERISGPSVFTTDTVRFRITGATPLLQNNPASMRGAEGQGLTVKRIPSPEDEAESKVYRLPDRQIYISATAFRSALIDAAKGLKFGKAFAKATIESGVFNTHEECPLFLPGSDTPITTYVIDQRRAVVQNNGVLRCRPRINAWETEIEFDYYTEFVPLDGLEHVFRRAGQIVGVGDFRPRPKTGKGGPFGRFSVERLS